MLGSVRNLWSVRSRSWTFMDPWRVKTPMPRFWRKGSLWRRHLTMSRKFTNWLNTIALLPGLFLLILMSSFVSASTLLLVVNSLRFILLRMLELGTCPSSFSSGVPATSTEAARGDEVDFLFPTLPPPSSFSSSPPPWTALTPPSSSSSLFPSALTPPRRSMWNGCWHAGQGTSADGAVSKKSFTQPLQKALSGQHEDRTTSSHVSEHIEQVGMEEGRDGVGEGERCEVPLRRASSHTLFENRTRYG
mmetsp:Transcript_23756/g.49505  ORF Transcript_23756/g.49505 Transcript_23756/m.49505 type:complete len:247 (-) Transcript_23756:772-1512(-)